MSNEHDEDAFWMDPAGYVNKQIQEGNRRVSVQQEFQQKYPDVPLEYAAHLAGQHEAEIKGLSDSAAMEKIAGMARQKLGNAQQQAGSSANPGSTASILKARKQRRREARTGFVAQPKR